MKKHQRRKYNNILIQTKVDAATAERLELLVVQGGFTSKYELLQYLVSVFLRVADPDNEGDETSAEHARWAELLKDWSNKTARIITTKPAATTAQKLVASVNIYKQPGKVGHIIRMIKVHGDEILQTSSVDKAVNLVLRMLWPGEYEQLQDVARACGSKSCIDAINALLETSSIPRVHAEDDDDDDDLGAAQNEYGNVPVRHNNKQMR